MSSFNWPGEEERARGRHFASKRASGKVNRLGETLRNCETSNLFDPAAPIDKDVYHVRSSKTEALQHRLD